VAATPYLVLQVVVPVLVTWLVLFWWITSSPWPGDGPARAGGLVLSAPSLLLMITLVAVVMSAGDVQELLYHLVGRNRQALLGVRERDPDAAVQL
jgi:hypothetical protein